ncbi:MAG: proline racemase family protein, partial [Megasphaera micronuciformis]
HVHLKDDYVVDSVSFDNVESFLYKENVEVDVPELGKKIHCDISFGGSFFAILPATEVDLDICPENASKFSKIGLIIRDAINKQVEVQHPTLDHIKTVDLVEFYGPAKSPDATYQNVVVFGEGSVDRSPCGTGTSAKVATLHAKGELKVGEHIIYESILGTKFKGEVLEETTIAGRKAIIPRITGSAYINGFNTFLVDPDDPLKHGFILG